MTTTTTTTTTAGAGIIPGAIARAMAAAPGIDTAAGIAARVRADVAAAHAADDEYCGRVFWLGNAGQHVRRLGRAAGPYVAAACGCGALTVDMASEYVQPRYVEAPAGALDAIDPAAFAAALARVVAAAESLEAYRAAEAARADLYFARQAPTARAAGVGDRVRVWKGRKVPVGTVGAVVYRGDDQYRRGHVRLGLRLDDGTRVYTDADNCRAADYDPAAAAAGLAAAEAAVAAAEAREAAVRAEIAAAGY